MMIVLYHANCLDGFCAAWVFHSKYPDAHYVPVQIGDPIPDIKDEDVRIVDFSFKRNELIKLRENNNNLLVLDHHKTAEEDLRGLPFCIFDMNKSGGQLAWQLLYINEPEHWLVRHTGDRDLWKFDYPETKLICAALNLYGFDFNTWDKLQKDELINQGELILKYELKLIEKAINNIRMVTFAGHSIPIVNSPNYQSEIGSILAEKYPFAIIWFQSKEGKFVFSLRSKGNMDVSAIAKQFNGGGHKNAAGFTLESLDEFVVR